MKEKILVAIKDKGLLEESVMALHEHDYIVTKASNLSDIESNLNSILQDVIILDSGIWMEERPDLLPNLNENYSESSIIHLISNQDQDKINNIIKNGEDIGCLLQPVTGKEVLVIVDQIIKHRQLKEGFNEIRNELLEANQKLSDRTRELQELSALNDNIIQSVMVGIITIDTGFIITSWNPGISHITGITDSVAKGSKLFDIIPSLGWKKVSERVKTVVQNGIITELGHLKTQKPDGDEIYANYKISPIKKEEDIVGAVIIVEDITQKVRLKDEVDRAQGYLCHLVENSMDAIMSFDLDGIIVTWNIGAEMMLGYMSQEVIGQPWDFLFIENDKMKMQNLFQWVKKSGALSNFETQILSKSGEAIPINLTLSLIKDVAGHVYGLSGIAKDLSEAKKLKRQIIQSQKMISLSAMASSMAHDINNPLASLSSYTHLLMTRTERLGISELTKNLAKVGEDANRIGQLVKDLLWYSTLYDHTIGLVDIHEVLKKSLSFASYLIDMEKVEIKREYFAKKPHIMANSRELIQAFINILTNAGEAMPDGGTITIQTMSMDQEDSKKEMDSLCIKISDTGIGIPEENLARIFEQFFTTKTNGKGNGLGLYVVQAIIENHHGHIEVESKVNQGTFFTIHLPIRTEQYINLSLEEKG